MWPHHPIILSPRCTPGTCRPGCLQHPIIISPSSAPGPLVAASPDNYRSQLSSCYCPFWPHHHIMISCSFLPGQAMAVSPDKYQSKLSSWDLSCFSLVAVSPDNYQSQLSFLNLWSLSPDNYQLAFSSWDQQWPYHLIIVSPTCAPGTCRAFPMWPYHPITISQS